MKKARLAREFAEQLNAKIKNLYGEPLFDEVEYRNPETGEQFIVEGLIGGAESAVINLLEDFADKVWDEAIFTPRATRISLNSYEEAASIAHILTLNGYQVLVWTDGETFGGAKEPSYTIEYIHPEWEGVGFTVEDY